MRFCHAFAFWPTRTVEGLRRAALTAAFQLPDDGDLTPGRRLFTALDEDGNGVIDVEEFVTKVRFCDSSRLGRRQQR